MSSSVAEHQVVDAPPPGAPRPRSPDRTALSQERVRVGVIGGGAWGTALARHCAHMGHDTLLWARESEVVAGVNDPAIKENTTYLKARLLGLQRQGALQASLTLLRELLSI